MKVQGKHYRGPWADESRGVVHIIDQTRLPHAFETATIADPEAMADAIRTMRIRGAPLIGVGAAYGDGVMTITLPRRDSVSAHLK